MTPQTSGRERPLVWGEGRALLRGSLQHRHSGRRLTAPAHLPGRARRHRRDGTDRHQRLRAWWGVG